MQEVIFPRTLSLTSFNANSDTSSASNATISLDDISDVLVAKRQRRQTRRRTLVCSLDIKSDGTFGLKPISQIDDGDYARQPLKGEWILQQNPYCVTDRQFDTLVLLTYPRCLRIKEWDKQFAMLEMRCQLYGRFGMKSIRDFVGWSHGRSAGKMVRGSIMLVRREQHGDVDLRKTRFFVPRWRRKIIIAKFSARPIPCGLVDADLSGVADNDDEWMSFDEEEDDKEEI